MLTRDTILATINIHKPALAGFGVSALGLFGSYARNEPKPQSDIDFLIDFEPGKESFDNLMAVVELLEASFPSQKIEVVTKSGLSPHIGPAILQSVVYA